MEETREFLNEQLETAKYKKDKMIISAMISGFSLCETVNTELELKMVKRYFKEAIKKIKKAGK